LRSARRASRSTDELKLFRTVELRFQTPNVSDIDASVAFYEKVFEVPVTRKISPRC
jgi:hypothetical protein